MANRVSPCKSIWEGPEAEQFEEIRALPFFLGPSLAITDWLPENLNIWQKRIVIRGNIAFFRHCTTGWRSVVPGKRWLNYAVKKSRKA